MQDHSAEYLTTRELADLLRIKERKVYDMAANGDVPCVRVVGKLLFPRAEIRAWLHSARSGPHSASIVLPNIFVGSHDPLLDWALRASGSGIAGFFDGSHDGLDRLAGQQAIACGLHIHEPDGWNSQTVAGQVPDSPVVLIEFARRQRGILTAPDNPHGITTLPQIKGHRLAQRQDSAASQRLLQHLAADQGLDLSSLDQMATPARTEQDIAAAIAEGRADVGFGIAAVAAQFKLDFIPVVDERFDILIWRSAYFDQPFQMFMKFLGSPDFKNRAAEMGGYDISGLGRIHYNAPVL
ncbi:helix-turn-helix transcriptional regulator [Pseudaestuariivita rosea]|uniref:helix-turn-helix transcriptional regulator n=1 Tax=Pseudaestuariivita rosea TaxID=2763263 RepID=UPI001ABBA79A|nr:helix-turn-helix transcriptional regulator [Pseudaestuariivita rosea]